MKIYDRKFVENLNELKIEWIYEHLSNKVRREIVALYADMKHITRDFIMLSH